MAHAHAHAHAQDPDTDRTVKWLGLVAFGAALIAAAAYITEAGTGRPALAAPIGELLQTAAAVLVVMWWLRRESVRRAQHIDQAVAGSAASYAEGYAKGWMDGTARRAPEIPDRWQPALHSVPTA